MPFMAALPAITMGASLLGRIFGGAAKGSADQRITENNQRLNQTQLGNSDAMARAGLLNSNANVRASEQNRDNQFRSALDLQRKQFSQNEPSAQARQALTGSLMSRIQPLSMSGGNPRLAANMPKMNSIIDAIGPGAREAGGLLEQRGLSGLRSGPSQFTDLPPVSLPDVLSLPPAQLAALKGSGLLEKILGAGGLIGSTVGALGDLRSVTPKDPGADIPGGYGGG